MANRIAAGVATGLATIAALALTACTTAETATDGTTTTEPSSSAESSTAEQTFTADVWADNWFALYINGELVGEDSVPITTERSFNKETITFTASYPLTIAIEAKDYKETDSGLEYIGEANQQMGDGGVIAQITDASGAAVAATSSEWSQLVTHRAPLDTSCESSSNPDAECTFTITEPDPDWFAVDYDASAWDAAIAYTAEEVGTKEGYDEVTWDASAQIVWASSLKQDNTVLLRSVVDAP